MLGLYAIIVSKLAFKEKTVLVCMFGFYDCCMYYGIVVWKQQLELGHLFDWQLASSQCLLCCMCCKTVESESGLSGISKCADSL